MSRTGDGGDESAHDVAERRREGAGSSTRRWSCSPAWACASPAPPSCPELAARGASVDEATGVARLPRELVEWALAQCPREHSDGRPHRSGRRPPGRGRALPLLAQRLRGQDARLPHRRAPRQHTAGRARGRGAERRAAEPRHHVDAGQRVRRAARAARAHRVLHAAHGDAQARHLRRLPDGGRGGRAAVRDAGGRPGALPRPPAHLDRLHRRVPAPGRRRAPRRARRARAASACRSRSTR